ncbi:DUF6993 domain-containing protein [Agromyces sp. NPDC058484]|uniref:DUF6993 domain-containing protein n=1 Tax=Agromyces sp. NPDC058484 TaxID=3346524 RepID=UPI00364CFEBE
MARRPGIRAFLALVAATVFVGAAGCTVSPSARLSATATAETSAAAPPTERAAHLPTLDPTRSAEENLAFFDSVNVGVVAANAEARGRDFIDALVAAGFDRSRMEITADRTTVDLPADSVQFAVLFQGRCLVGQFGVASGGYHGAVRPALGTGGCLVGQTRPIDW